MGPDTARDGIVDPIKAYWKNEITREERDGAAMDQSLVQVQHQGHFRRRARFSWENNWPCQLLWCERWQDFDEKIGVKFLVVVVFDMLVTRDRGSDLGRAALLGHGCFRRNYRCSL